MAYSQYYGMRGSRVREIQKKLNETGAGLAMDGIWGPKTEAAYQKYGGEQQAGGEAEDTLKRIEYTPLTDEQIEKIAQEETQADYGNRESLENERADALRQAVQKSIENLDPAYRARLDALEKAYTGRKKEMTDLATSRGMGRSSYALDLENAAYNDLAGGQSTLLAEKQAKLQALGQEIEDIQKKLAETVAGLEMERTSTQNKASEALKSERGEKIQEAIEYNNEIAIKEAEMKRKQAEFEQKMQKSSARSGSKSSSGTSSKRLMDTGMTESAKLDSQKKQQWEMKIMENWNAMSTEAKKTYFQKNWQYIFNYSSPVARAMAKNLEKITGKKYTFLK